MHLRTAIIKEAFMDSKHFWFVAALAGVSTLSCAPQREVVAATTSSGSQAPFTGTTSTTITTTNTPVKVSPGLGLGEDLIKACDIKFGDPDQAPKFAFDRSELTPDDDAVLDQVARCVTTGPLKGRHLHLVGRADPRGEVEYNMVLGEHRSGGVLQYLEQLGVAGSQLDETSRGKLDATGTDEATWARDRRVDIDLR
jgi:peptidoglycan-associated lipoprotein